MNICYASNDYYAKIMITSIKSVINYNEQEKMNFYIINDNISDENISVLKKLQNDQIYIKIIDFKPYEEKIKKIVKETNPPLPAIAFARLYIGSMIQEDRVIYMDCDTCCMNSINELWNYDLGENIIGAVEDTVNSDVKIKIGMHPENKYYNSGILVIDLNKWRLNGCEINSINYIVSNNGYVMHNDQGVINALFNDKIVSLPIKYNVMTPILLVSRYKILKYFGIEDYYNRKELLEAKKNPVIVHYVRFTTSRPWEKKCRNPHRDIFITCYKEVFGETLELEEYRLSNGQKVLYWILENMPYHFYECFLQILKLRR